MLRPMKLELLSLNKCTQCGQSTDDIHYMLVMETSSPKDPRHVFDKEGGCGHIFRVDITIKAPWHNDAELFAIAIQRAGEVLLDRVNCAADAAEGGAFRRDLVVQRNEDHTIEVEQLYHIPEGHRSRDTKGRFLDA